MKGLFKSLVLSLFLLSSTGVNALEPDKRLHLLGGAATGSTVYKLTGDTDKALTAVILVGVGKELYDATGRGTVEVEDAVATIVGGILTVMFLDSRPTKPRFKPMSMEYHKWRTTK